MVLCDPSTDDSLRGRQSRQEPSACPRSARADARASSRTQRRPRHRGQPDRGRQARPEGLDGGTAGQSSRRPAGRPSALTTGPAPGPKRAAEDRPLFRCAYRTFTMCRSGTTELTDAIFILLTPSLQRWDVRADPDPPCKATGTCPLRRASGSSRRSATAQPFRQSRSSRRLTSSRVVSPADRRRPSRLASLTFLAPTIWGRSPSPARACGDRPLLRCAYFPLNVCRSGTAELTDAIFILLTPSLQRCDVRASFKSPLQDDQGGLSETYLRPCRVVSTSTRTAKRSSSSRWIRTSWMPLSQPTKTNPSRFPRADDRAGPRSYASGRRPARIAACLLRLKHLQKRHDRIDGRDLHPCSPPPAVRPSGSPGRRGKAKEILNAGGLVSANHARARARTYAQARLKNFNKI